MNPPSPPPSPTPAATSRRDEMMMRRAIELARHGLGTTSPNPMVGAVLALDDGTVIGEGWHRRYGDAHAEVNAVAAVANRSLLRSATLYVTLEPCSHFGKTPPCSRLILECGIPRVVVGMLDPAPWVAGRGVAMLRDAGVEVAVGLLEEECRTLNPAFITAHTLGRPWVTLKWAQSADGFIDRKRSLAEPPTRFSTPLTAMLVHRLRSLHDAILIGSTTALADRPQLTTRLWPGRNALAAVADRRGRLSPCPDRYLSLNDPTPADLLLTLSQRGVTSLLVEGGAHLLKAFIDAGIYDMVRIETAPLRLGEGITAPTLAITPTLTQMVGDNRIDLYGNLPWWVGVI